MYRTESPGRDVELPRTPTWTGSYYADSHIVHKVTEPQLLSGKRVLHESVTSSDPRLFLLDLEADGRFLTEWLRVSLFMVRMTCVETRHRPEGTNKLRTERNAHEEYDGNTSVLKLCIQDPGIELDDVQRVSFGRGELHVPLFHVITHSMFKFVLTPVERHGKGLELKNEKTRYFPGATGHQGSISRRTEPDNNLLPSEN